MKMTEKQLLKMVTIILAIMMFIWGYLNYTLKIYGEIGQILGVFQIIVGAVIVIGIKILK